MKFKENSEEIVEQIETGKDQIEKTILNIKNDIHSSIQNFKDQRKTMFKNETARLKENPLLVVIEVFFIGLYAGKLVHLLRDHSSKNRNKFPLFYGER